MFYASNSLSNGTNPITLTKRDVTGRIERKRRIAGSSLEPCNEDQLMIYLAELQAINPESIINLSTFDELLIICREVSVSLDKVDEYLKTCEIRNHRSLYLQLIKGVDKLYCVLCEESSKIRKEFQDNFPCLKQLHEDFETCFGPADWTENLSKKDICIAYKDIADCYYIKAEHVCGKRAARAMKSLVRAVVESIINIHCSATLINPCTDISKGQGSNEIHISVYFVIVANILYIIIN